MGASLDRRAHRGAKWRDTIALSLLALSIGLARNGAKSIVLDESTSVEHARLPLRLLFSGIDPDLDPNMRLYYVLLHFWIGVFGESETAVRSLSAIFAAAAVATIYHLGSRLHGRRVGIAAALLLAVNALLVDFAQTARSYSLSVFLVTLSSLLFVKELEQPSPKNRIGYVLASVGAVYAHFMAALVPLSHAVALVALRRRAAFTAAWLAVAASVALGCVPAAALAVRRGPGGIDWIEPVSFGDLLRVPVELAGGSITVLLVLLVAGSAAVAAAIGERGVWRLGVIAAWLVVPVVTSLAISFERPVFQSSYLIVCAPALVLFGASALRLARPPTAAALALALIGLSAAQLSRYYARPAVQDWRGAASFVLSASRPGDGVLFVPDYASKPFQYYARRTGGPVPDDVSNTPLEDEDRVWLVTRESDRETRRAAFEQAASRLELRHRVAERHRFLRVGVELYVR